MTDGNVLPRSGQGDRIASTLTRSLEIIKLREGEAFTSQVFTLQLEVAILSSLISISGVEREDLKRGWIKTALFSMKKSNDNSLDGFRTAVEKNARDFLSTPKTEYTVIIPLNATVKQRKAPRNVSVAGTTFSIRSWHSLNRLALEEWNRRLIRQTKRPLFHDRDFIPLISRVTSINPFFALVDTLQACELFRASLHVLETIGRTRWQIGTPRPIASFLDPPAYVVFTPDGRIAEDFTNPFPAPQYAAHKLSDDHVLGATRFLRHLEQRKKTPLYEQVIVPVIRLYGRSLESHRSDDTLLGLWQCLERMTFPTEESGKTSEVCRRTKMLLGAEPLLIDVLEVIADTRNNLVHAGVFPNTGTDDRNFLKIIVDSCLDRLLGLAKNVIDAEGLNIFYSYASVSDKRICAVARVTRAIRRGRKLGE